MNARTKIVVGVLAVAAAAVGAWLCLSPEQSAEPAKPAKQERPKKPRRIADAKSDRAAKRPKRPERPARRAAADVAPEMSEADQKIYDAIQDALDDDSLDGVRKSLDAAAKSADRDVREQAVSALAWFGKEALPELTMFMADADEDVRVAACDAWVSGVSEVEDEATRGGLVLSAMNVVRGKDQLESMAAELNTLSDARQVEIIQTLIEGDNASAAAVAREQYEFLTGDPYESAAAAEKWLQENADEDEE